MTRRPYASEAGSRWRRWGLLGVLVLAGCLQAISFAWPWPDAQRGEAYGLLQIVALTALAAVVERSTSAREVFVRTWWFALAWLLASTWWLYISLHDYGGLPAVLTVLAVGLLAAALALPYAALLALYRSLTHAQMPLLARMLGFAAAWTLAELFRAYVATGFPWGAIGYAHIDDALRHWAPWLGVYGVGAIAAALALLCGTRHTRSRHRSGGLWHFSASAALMLALAWTWWDAPSRQPHPEWMTPPLRVRLLQGNVPQDLKFSAGAAESLRDYGAALRHSDAALTVTPETAIPFLPEQLPADYWRALRPESGHAVLIGVPMPVQGGTGNTGEMGGRYTNSVLGLLPDGNDYRYDKHHLVPFGEFVPPGFVWFVRQMHIPLGDFARGALPQPPLPWQGQRIAPNICFEDLFGEALAQSFAEPAQAPTLLLNLSNLAWFGDTVALDQHLQIARMRAIELGRPMLRATNTGATAVIDAQGTVVQRLPYATHAALTADVQGVAGPVTPYARWVSACGGLWPMALVACGVLLVLAWMQWRGRHGPRRFAKG